jgi:hypothetical protein
MRARTFSASFSGRCEHHVIDPDLREQNVDTGDRPLAEGVVMLEQKGLAATTALFFQHCQERALRVELRRSPELGEPVRYDQMGAHRRPSRAFAAAGIGALSQERRDPA